MSHPAHRTDAELLLDAEAEAFATFYRRHLPWVLRYALARVRDPEIAADVAGEVFATVLEKRQTFNPAHPSAEPWLQRIARNVLVDSVRRGQVEDRARRKLGISVLTITDDDLDRLDTLIDEERGHTPAVRALDELPAEQSDAVRARVLEDVAYDELAEHLRCSSAVARQRVSRGLRALRTIVKEGT